MFQSKLLSKAAKNPYAQYASSCKTCKTKTDSGRTYCQRCAYKANVRSCREKPDPLRHELIVNRPALFVESPRLGLKLQMRRLSRDRNSQRSRRTGLIEIRSPSALHVQGDGRRVPSCRTPVGCGPRSKAVNLGRWTQRVHDPSKHSVFKCSWQSSVTDNKDYAAKLRFRASGVLRRALPCRGTTQRSRALPRLDLRSPQTVLKDSVRSWIGGYIPMRITVSSALPVKITRQDRWK